MDPIPEQVLFAVQARLHALVRRRAGHLIDQYSIPLPALADMLAGQVSELFRPAHGGPPETWFFRVPGMYGGFRLVWLTGGTHPALEAVSFCRVVGGSGQRHHLSATDTELVEEGFV